jgi:hypothetical protein
VDVQARVLATLKEMVETPVCKLKLNQYPPLLVENTPSGPPQTPKQKVMYELQQKVLTPVFRIRFMDLD